jgi:mannosyltransferase
MLRVEEGNGRGWSESRPAASGERVGLLEHLSKPRARLARGASRRPLGWVRVGDKARRVWVDAEVARLLRAYLLLERPVDESRALFVQSAGGGRGRPLTAAGLRKLARHHRALGLGRSADVGPARLAFELHPAARRALVDRRFGAAWASQRRGQARAAPSRTLSGAPAPDTLKALVALQTPIRVALQAPIPNALQTPVALQAPMPGALLARPKAWPEADQTLVLPHVPVAVDAPLGVNEPDIQPAHDADGSSAVLLAGRRQALAHVAWLVPTALMATLGLIRLGWPGLWADELATWGMITASWSQMWSVLGKVDAVIGPYYLITRCSAEIFGTSDVALRLPSVIAMTAAVAVTARIGTRLATPRVGLVAGLMLALFPTTSRYAQEARPYAFTVFAAALATLLLVRLLENPGHGRLIAYAGAVSMLGLTHPIALLLVVAHGCLVLLTRRKAMVRWTLGGMLGVLPVLPFVVLGSRQKAQTDWIPPTDLDRLANLPHALFGLGVIGGILWALALLSCSLRRPAVHYTTWAVVPMVGLYLASQITPLWVPRYLLFTLPAWALLGATALARAPVIRGVVAAVAIGVIGIAAQLDLRQPDGHGQATRDAAALIESSVQTGDVIVYGPNVGDEGRAGRDLVARYIPSDRRPVDALVVQAPRTAGNFLATECADVGSCLGTPRRVWVVRLGTYDNPLFEIGTAKAETLGADYVLESVWHPTGMTVALFSRKPT